MADAAHRPAGALSLLALFASLVSQNLGAAIAKSLFPVVGVAGMAALRIGLSALLLLAFWRPWRHPLARRDWGNLAAYGAMLGGMNLCIYHAFGRVPIGIATAIETTGPLVVVLAASRRALDVAWVALALAGLALLLPSTSGHALDPLGLLFSFGAALSWALYIVFGKRVSTLARGQAVSLGMLVAALFAVPLGMAGAGAAMAVPTALLAGLGVALLSSAVPYSLEMAALRRLPRHVFGILVSATPAVGAACGAIVLGERLTAPQWLAIALIIGASAGGAATAGRPSPDTAGV
ncbi:MAG: EamA family transporter [Burkholderiaceae bacterium]